MNSLIFDCLVCDSITVSLFNWIIKYDRQYSLENTIMLDDVISINNDDYCKFRS